MAFMTDAIFAINEYLDPSSESIYNLVAMKNEYFIHDARKLTEKVKEEVDLIITSPPYYDTKDYEVVNQIGFQQSYEQFLADMGTVFLECIKTTKTTGSMWVIVDSLKRNGTFRLLPFDLVKQAQNQQWKLQEIIIWQKDRTLPFSKHGEMRNIFEYVLFFTKSRKFKFYPDRIRSFDKLKNWWAKWPERYSVAGKAPTNIWTFPIPIQGSWGKNHVRHFCPLPAALIGCIIELCSDPGDTIFDPFAGSGAVLKEAYLLDRDFIGCDINPKYRTMFDELFMAIEGLPKTSSIQYENKAFFAEMIKKLRILKLPSALLKKLRRTYPEVFDEILGVLAIPTHELNMKKNKLWQVKYTFYLRERSKELEERIQRVLDTKPLTKYGIQPMLCFIEGFQPKNIKQFNVYPWDTTYKSPMIQTPVQIPFIASNLSFDTRERRLINSCLTP